MEIKESDQQLVCVIMPVYNGAKTIGMALKSLLLQSYTNWMCVIVNDGSTDETKSILDALEDKRFNIIHLKENKGRGYARQVALDNAKGDYLTYLDADDFYHKEKLASQVSVFQSNKDVVLTACGQGSFEDDVLKRTRGVKFHGVHNFNYGDNVLFVPVTSMVLLDEARKFSYNRKLNASEDTEYFSHYLDGKSYHIGDKILYYYAEYGSVDYSKIVEYSYYSILRTLYMYKKLKMKALKYFTKELFKSTIYVCLYPVLGKSFFLKQRGHIPSEADVSSFKLTLDSLN